jgi:hypothetical protein
MREPAVVDRHVNQNSRRSVMSLAPRTHGTHRARGRTLHAPAIRNHSPVQVRTAERVSRGDGALRCHGAYFLLGAARAGHEGYDAHWQVACPVELQHDRSDRVADCLNNRRVRHARLDHAHRSRALAMSMLSPRSGKSCYTPVKRVCVHTFAQRTRRDHSPAMIDAHFSPIMTHAACVGAFTIVGMIDASAMRRPSMPRTRRSPSTTASRSDAGPMRQVPAA